MLVIIGHPFVYPAEDSERERQTRKAKNETNGLLRNEIPKKVNELKRESHARHNGRIRKYGKIYFFAACLSRARKKKVRVLQITVAFFLLLFFFLIYMCLRSSSYIVYKFFIDYE